MFEFLAGLDPVALAVGAVVAVVGGFIGLQAFLGWLRAFVVRLAFRHVAFAGASALGGAVLDRVTSGGVSGVLDGALDLALSLVGFG